MDLFSVIVLKKNPRRKGMAKLIKCKSCGASISKKAKACPQCAEPAKKSIGLGGLLVLVVFSVFIYGLLNPTPQTAKKAQQLPTTKEDVAKKTEQLLTELKTIPASQYSENYERYVQLSSMHPQEQKYKDKVIHYKGKIDRVKTIEKQFSGWDGSHTEFSKYLKNRLKNPDSYDHVKTLYVDKGDHILIETTYRATNSFNAVTTGKGYAKANIDGSSLEIISIE